MGTHVMYIDMRHAPWGPPFGAFMATPNYRGVGVACQPLGVLCRDPGIEHRSIEVCVAGAAGSRPVASVLLNLHCTYFRKY